MIVFALIAVGWWLAAPDRFTAAARTASGTGLKAAGTGAKVHWNGGRDGRALGRTKRRDRWAKRGGWWRKLLGLEHGAVITGKAVKGAGRLAGAAVKPVPGAIRDGWRAGQARHGARTAGRPVPVALDPPWWRRPDPAPVPDGTGQDSPQDSGTAAEDSPEPARGQPEGRGPVFDKDGDPNLDVRCANCGQLPDQTTPIALVDGQPICMDCRGGLSPRDQWLQAHYPNGAVRPQPLDAFGRPTLVWPGKPPAPVPPPTDPPAGTPFFPDAPDGPVLDSEEDIRARNRNPELVQIKPGPMTEAQRRFWHLRDRGYPGALDQDGWPAPDFHTGAIVNPMPYLKQPAGTDPAGATTPTPEGDSPVSVTVPAEIGDLTTLHQFADTVIADAEENGPGNAYAQACSSLREYFSRDFGQEVNTATGAFEEAAAALTAAWTQLVEAAQGVKQEALTSIGG